MQLQSFYHKSLNDGKLGWLKQKILDTGPVKQDLQQNCKQIDMLLMLQNFCIKKSITKV